MKTQLDRIEAKLDRLLEQKKKPLKAKVVIQYDDYFNKLWEFYPKRNGSNPKNKAYSAYKARLKEGIQRVAIHHGLIRYVNWCNATHKTGTETVMQAARFFGPGLEFENDWALPVETAEHLPAEDGELIEFARERGLSDPGRGETWTSYRARLGVEMKSKQGENHA